MIRKVCSENKTSGNFYDHHEIEFSWHVPVKQENVWVVMTFPDCLWIDESFS